MIIKCPTSIKVIKNRPNLKLLYLYVCDRGMETGFLSIIFLCKRSSVFYHFLQNGQEIKKSSLRVSN